MFLIACVLCTVAGYAQQGPLATTQYGVLEGVCESGVNVFKGVPFAATRGRKPLACTTTAAAVARRAQCEEFWRRPHAG